MGSDFFFLFRPRTQKDRKKSGHTKQNELQNVSSTMSSRACVCGHFLRTQSRQRPSLEVPEQNPTTVESAEARFSLPPTPPTLLLFPSPSRGRSVHSPSSLSPSLTLLQTSSHRLTSRSSSFIIANNLLTRSNF